MSTVDNISFCFLNQNTLNYIWLYLIRIDDIMDDNEDKRYEDIWSYYYNVGFKKTPDCNNESCAFLFLLYFFQIVI